MVRSYLHLGRVASHSCGAVLKSYWGHAIQINKGKSKHVHVHNYDRRGSTPVCIDACASINRGSASFHVKVRGQFHKSKLTIYCDC